MTVRSVMLGLLGAVFPSIVGAICFFVSGEQTVRFRVLPGQRVILLRRHGRCREGAESV